MENGIPQHLQNVRARIRRAAADAGRHADDIVLLAVSKQQSVNAIRAAAACGQHRFGESYLQEAQSKKALLRDLDVEWHFIGRLQSRKCKDVAREFDWLQSLDRWEIAEKLSRHRPPRSAPLNVLIQVNPQGESSKGGIPLQEIMEFARQIVSLPRLRLRGLMCLPSAEAAHAAAAFTAVKDAFDRLRNTGMALDTLSMGMSGDLETAIACGATMVRVGTALFGERMP